MNVKIRSLSLLLVALAMGGCMDQDDGGPDGPGDPQGSLLVTWTTQTADGTGAGVPAACPAGATSAIVFALADGATEPGQFRTSCAAGSLQLDGLSEGGYTVWVRLTDSAFLTQFAESASQLAEVAVGTTTPIPDYPIFIDHGFFTVSWNLVRDGGLVSCADVPGDNRMAIDVTGPGGTLFFTVVDCEAGEVPAAAITRPLPSGVGSGPAYTVSIQLLTADLVPIGDATVIPPDGTGEIDYGNKYQDLGTVDVVVDSAE